MADRLTGYEQRVGVQDAGSFRPVLPERTNAGDDITRLGNSLLQTAKPIVEDRAERAAIEAAGDPDLLKDAAGNYMKPVMPKGAGLIYARTYDRVMDARYEGLVEQDTQIALNNLAAENSHDPVAFLAKGEGTIQGILKAVPDRNKASLELTLLRELRQRHGGIAQLKASNDWQAAATGLAASGRSNTEAAALAYAQGGAGKAEGDRLMGVARDAYAKLGIMGEMTPTGIDAASQSMLNDVGPAIDVGTSLDNFAALTPGMQGLTDDELSRLALFGAGGTDGGKVGDMDLAGFKKLFPSKQVGGQFGSLADRAVSLRVAQRNADEAARKAAAAEDTNQKILAAIKSNNFEPVLGYTEDQVVALEARTASRGDVYTQMGSPEGRLALLGDIGGSGYMPKGVSAYIDGQVMGQNVEGVADFVQSVKGLNARGAWVGQSIYEQLAPQTRATLEYNETLKRAGFPQSARQAQLEAKRTGALPRLEEVITVFPRERGKTYSEQKRKALQTALGATDAQAAIAVVPSRDFDALLPYNMQLYGGDVAQAVKATAASVANAYVPSAFFAAGFGDKKLVKAGFSIGDLDAVLTVADKSNVSRASFAAGTAKLRPVSDNPGRGFGLYRVEYTSPTGRPLGASYADLDVLLKPVMERTNARRRAKQDELRRNAKAPPPMPKLPYTPGMR